MTTELLETIKKDIQRCEEAQSSNKGSYKLYQALIAKYNGLFEDLKSLKEVISDSSNRETCEIAKQQLYKDVTAKYDAYIPQFSDGLYGYAENCKFYDE